MKKLLLILLCLPLITLAQQTSPPLEYFNPIHSSYFKSATDTINFSQDLGGTVITNQYIQQGALFSGVGTLGPQVIDFDTIGNLGKVLHSHNWYDPIRIDFVDTVIGTSINLVQKIGFLNAVWQETDYIKIDVYDQIDNLLYHYLSASPEYVTIDFGIPEAAYMILDDSANTAYVIDNIILDFGVHSTSLQEHSSNKELLKVTDLLGRETKEKNQPLFYIYDDGTVEKRLVIE